MFGMVAFVKISPCSKSPATLAGSYHAARFATGSAFEVLFGEVRKTGVWRLGQRISPRSPDLSLRQANIIREESVLLKEGSSMRLEGVAVDVLKQLEQRLLCAEVQAAGVSVNRE